MHEDAILFFLPTDAVDADRGAALRLAREITGRAPLQCLFERADAFRLHCYFKDDITYLVEFPAKGVRIAFENRRYFFVGKWLAFHGMQ